VLFKSRIFKFLKRDCGTIPVAEIYNNNNNNLFRKKLKGIKKAVLKKEISFEDYKNCLFNQKEYFHRQKVIRSHKHDIFTEEVKKKSLSWKDDKRYLLPNSTDTLAYGHVLVSS
jgi:hypothetical protein